MAGLWTDIGSLLAKSTTEKLRSFDLAFSRHRSFILVKSKRVFCVILQQVQNHFYQQSTQDIPSRPGYLQKQCLEQSRYQDLLPPGHKYIHRQYIDIFSCQHSFRMDWLCPASNVLYGHTFETRWHLESEKLSVTWCSWP